MNSCIRSTPSTEPEMRQTRSVVPVAKERRNQNECRSRGEKKARNEKREKNENVEDTEIVSTNYNCRHTCFLHV